MPYQNFVVDPKLKKDVWVRASQVRPGNPSVVHHLVVFVLPPGSRDRSRRSTSWPAYAPGMPPRILPEGVARLVPAGSRLMFQVHYTPRGIAADRPQRDRPGLRRPQDDPQGDDRDRRDQHGAAHPGRRRRLRGRGRPPLRPGHDRLLAPAPHAPAGQVVPVRGGLPRRPSRGAAGRAAVRVRLAERLRPRRAEAHARGERAALPGPVRQLGRQPVEPRPEGDRHLGRADARRDARRLRGGRAWPTRTSPWASRTARKLRRRPLRGHVPLPSPGRHRRRSTWPAPSTTGSRPR